MKKKKMLVFLLFFFIPQLVSAGIISLTTSVSSDIITENSGKIYVKLTNLGDEAAYDVKVSLLTENSESRPITIGNLNPNEPIEMDFLISLKKTIYPGKYPVVVLIDYADANGYPFSSVSPSFIVYKNSTVSKISGLIQEITLNEKEGKKLTLSVRNLDDVEHDVDVKLALPREIRVDEGEKRMSLGSKQEKSLDFEVSSLSAISGSTYAAIASIEYEEDGFHYSSFANGVIKIGSQQSSSQEEKPPGQFSTYSYIVLFISIVIVLIYVYPKYIKRGKK